MIEMSLIKINGKSAVGLRIEMPQAPPLVLARGERGVVFCGYLNPEAAEKFDLAAAIVRGVNNVDELLDKPVSYCTKRAESLGARSGMSGREALGLFL
jgi:uncharacterized protein YunC (DUF1805 family)